MIKIHNELIFDKSLSDNDVMIYAFLKILTYSENYDSCLFSVSEVVDQIFGEANSHSISGMVNRSLKHLMEKGYILTTKKSQSSWHIFMSSFKLEDDEKYTIVEPEALRKIVDAEVRNKPSLLRYYLMVMSTVFANTKAGTCDRSWFAERMGVKPDVVSRYTEKLEKLKILYVYRAANFYMSNTYGAYEDKECVESEGKRRSNNLRASEKANERRRNVARFQNFLNGKEYPIKDLKEIYEVMKKRNSEIYEAGVSARGVPYDLEPLVVKIKDLEYNENNAKAQE